MQANKDVKKKHLTHTNTQLSVSARISASVYSLIPLTYLTPLTADGAKKKYTVYILQPF